MLAFLMTTSSNCYPVVKATAWKSSELNCRIRKQRTEEVRPFVLLFDDIWISNLWNRPDRVAQLAEYWGPIRRFDSRRGQAYFSACSVRRRPSSLCSFI